MEWITDMKEVDDDFKKKLQTKKKAGAWFASHCITRSKREKYVKLLQEALVPYGLTVDIYGGCGTFRCPRTQANCKAKVQTDYYFYLSFENAFAEDYVTEKLLTALNHNAVPIVYGGSNYSSARQTLSKVITRTPKYIHLISALNKFQSIKISAEQKARIFNQYILPVLTYGAEIWIFTKDVKVKVPEGSGEEAGVGYSVYAFHRRLSGVEVVHIISFLPPGSYIDARKHEPAELAALMAHLISTPSEYYEYFRWRNHYSYSKSESIDGYCNVCAALNDKEKVLTQSVYEHFRSWWNPDWEKRCRDHNRIFEIIFVVTAGTVGHATIEHAFKWHVPYPACLAWLLAVSRLLEMLVDAGVQGGKVRHHTDIRRDLRLVQVHIEAHPLGDSVEAFERRAEFLHRLCHYHDMVGKPKLSDVFPVHIDAYSFLFQKLKASSKATVNSFGDMTSPCLV
ncbi:hypothetical protein MSG28_000148 [Choristoneura fumiferana]|uniref:Uncharacterized protein n=1 Tax=Choristoneura fumiferana TaxID=7141 RepID=A0ACC0JZZ5_CHOFU|nr:hypothetical protein MSG28_000148 [Choristoneura fumiferana]